LKNRNSHIDLILSSRVVLLIFQFEAEFILFKIKYFFLKRLVFGFKELLETIGIIDKYKSILHFLSYQSLYNLAYSYCNALNSTTCVFLDIIGGLFVKTKFGFKYFWGQQESKDGESESTISFILFCSESVILIER